MTNNRRAGGPGGATERLRRAALIVLSTMLLTAAACSKDNKGSTTTTSAPPTTAATETTTTTVPFTKESIVLAADGLGTLTFGTNAARTISQLMSALGQPEKNTPLPVGTPCGATRRLQWGNFQVLVNEVGAASGAGKPGFAGWYLGAASPNKLDFKTEKGITIGSTVAALKAAYGADVNVARGEEGPGFNVTLAKGIMLGQLDALTDAGKVRNIQSGSYCGAA